jgi:zinc protease
MWVKTGSADEARGEEGISHFIEHLVFKGTDKFGVGEIASSVEAAGGELNAYTSFDQTVFYVTISRQFSDVALEAISEMMGFPKFDSGEIDNEREVVIEEIKRSNDSPSRQASRLLFSTAYKKHPYGIPVIGYDKVVKGVSRKKLLAYYGSRYVPSNMLLVVAGDFEAKEMSGRIRERFGRLKPLKLRRVARKKEPRQAQARTAALQAKFEEAQFHLAWKIPGAKHKDIAALDVLAMILGQGDSSRLVRKLRLEQPIVNSIGAGSFTPKDCGIFSVSATLPPEQMRPALAALTEELARMVSEPPQAAEIAKAIVNLESEEFYALETVDGSARKAGSFETLMGDHAYFKKFLKQVNALTAADLLRAARKYLAPRELTAVGLSSRAQKETALALRDWQKAYAAAYAKAIKVKAAPGKKAASRRLKWKLPSASASDASGVERVRLKSGAMILFRPSHATPVLSAKAAFLGGLRIEPDSSIGLTELLSRVWTTGTKTLSEDEISTRVEAMAGSLSAFGGRNSAGLSMHAISPFEDQAIELFADVLANPSLPAATLDREKVVLLEEIKSRADNPAQVASQLFIDAIFAGHPYGRDPMGEPETLANIDSAAVAGHWRKMATGNNLLFAIAGSVNKEKWIDKLEAATAPLSGGSRLISSLEHLGPQRDELRFQALEREQTHIIVGYKGLTLTDPRRYALQAIQSLLAGQGGRLFLELRDKASLAYSVAPMRMEGVDTGYFGAYIGCSPEKGEKAIAMLRAEFDKLASERPSDAELDRAKRYLIGRHDIDLQRSSAIASSLLFNEIYGIDAEETFRYAERLAAVTADEVRALAQAIFSQPSALVAVGSRQPW